MEKFRVLVRSTRARIDLLEIWTYLAEQASAEVADAQLRRIQAASDSLPSGPFQGRARSELKLGLRSVVVDPYVVFYRVTETTVEIVRVLHGRRDFRKAFKHDIGG